MSYQRYVFRTEISVVWIRKLVVKNEDGKEVQILFAILFCSWATRSPNVRAPNMTNNINNSVWYYQSTSLKFGVAAKVLHF